MRRLIATVLLVALTMAQPAADAAAKLRIIATIPDLKALIEAVGGNLVEVESLARGNQNPHDLEVRPSLMVKLRRADALVVNGLELDQWADGVSGAPTTPGWCRAPPATSTRPAACRCSTCRPRASIARWATSTRSAIPTTRSIRDWRRRSPRRSSTGSSAWRPSSGPRSSGSARRSSPVWSRRWPAGRPR